MKYQSHCCQLCGTPIGWLGRLFQAFGGGFHQFDCRPRDPSPSTVKSLPPPKNYPRLADLAGDIRAAIDKHNGELPLASVIGVLEIVKARLIEENTP